MLTGFRNAPATFQTLMDFIFYDCMDDFFVVYLDDILVYSNTRQEYLAHFRTILSQFKEHKLYVEKNKYELFETETEFLTLQVKREGISIGEDWERAITD